MKTKMFITSLTLLISSLSNAFIDPFKKPERTYSWNDIDVVLICDDSSNNGQVLIKDFIVLGESDGFLNLGLKVFFNINDKLKKGKNIGVLSKSDDEIVMDGGFLKYQFDLKKNQLKIVNAEGTLISTTNCHK